MSTSDLSRPNRPKHWKRILSLAFLPILVPALLAASALAAEDASSLSHPTVSLLLPTEGSTVSGTVGLSATCVDDRGCTEVRYFVDGVQVASDSTLPDWSEGWDTTSVADGEHTIYATGRDAAGNVTRSASVRFTVQNGPVWSAGMEMGNLSEWSASWDSGLCIRPPSGVSTAVARTGRYSMAMTIDTSAGRAGCRQFRNEESLSGRAYYYGAWFYIPAHTKVTGRFWQIFQFKSRLPNASGSDPIWTFKIANRNDTGAMHLILRWRADHLAGPFEGDGIARRTFRQTLVNVPVGRWFHLEAYLRQSGGYDGRITVWQDGIKLWKLDQVRTKYADGDQRWSVDNYSNGLSPSPHTIYVDDATVATARSHSP
jgi:Bacterial Ig domain/Polysaccharide lyase